GLFTSVFGTESDIVVVFDYFGSDKTFFEIGMDNTCTLRSLTAFQIGPCSYFLRSGGEVGFEIEQAVSRSDQTGNARFFQAYFLKEHLSFLVSFELGDFR